MMLILALDCSTARGSVAFAVGNDLEDFQIVRRAEFPAGRGHGGELFATLESGLAELRVGKLQLEEIVVGLGPGSYSGVRQAIAASVGLALATGARLHGRPSTAAMPLGRDPAHVVGDARRGAFYYTAVENGECIAGPELLPDLDALQSRLHAQPGWRTVAMETLPAGLPPETPVFFPQAEGLLLGSPGSLAPPPLEPIYLRPVSITLPRVLTANVAT